MFHDGRENGCNHTCMGALLVICKVNRNDAVQRILKVHAKEQESVVYQSSMFFNAAQPGVGRVQVLGSKKSLEKEKEQELLGIQSLEVDQWISVCLVWHSERWPSPGCPQIGGVGFPNSRVPQPEGCPPA